MGDYGLIAAITGIFCVVCGVFAARLAHKSYALVVAGTYLLQMLALGIVASAVMGIEITMWHFIVPTILAFIVSGISCPDPATGAAAPIALTGDMKIFFVPSAMRAPAEPALVFT